MDKIRALARLSIAYDNLIHARQKNGLNTSHFEAMYRKVSDLWGQAITEVPTYLRNLSRRPAIAE